ncbi:MAG: topoisomerase DNA-binding C4 zinc finger domain-containing protein [Chloroflexi bacterium]|nr:topoisomerase DNA-binding C4 zinc finger domain-containing protein [Chloroflexota bacterium]MBU1749634.1 topoisomerase DNA-binding C4 zinc finger domain-containing protein [Chloroflexota bacterium]
MQGLFWGCRNYPDCRYTQTVPAEQFQVVLGQPFDRRGSTP